MRRWGRILAPIAATGIAVAAATAGVEWYLRRIVSSTRLSNVRPDATLGWDSVPSMVSIGNTGNRPAVYFAGDSFTQGKQWPAIAQRGAAARGVGIDGYVLGVVGFGTTQEWLKIERDFDRHRPRLVVLQLYAWNDLRDNWPYPAIAYSPTVLGRPYLVPDANGYHVVAARPSAWPLSALERTELWRSLGFRAALRLDDYVARVALDALARWRLPLSVDYSERATWEPFYRPTDADRTYVREAYGATREAFRRLDRFLRARGARLVVAGLDNPFTVDPDVADVWLRPDVSVDLGLPLRRIGELLREEGIPFVDARPALLAVRQRTGRKVYNPPAGALWSHLEPAGEEAFGSVVAEQIVDALGGGH